MSENEAALRAEIEELKAKLAEARATLGAIRRGEVDALVVTTRDGNKVFTLQGADRFYRVLFETLSEGVVTVIPEGTILYSNRRFADIIKTPLQRVIGARFADFVAPEDRVRLAALLRSAAKGSRKGAISLTATGGGNVSAHISLRPVKSDEARAIGIVVTDATEEIKLQERIRQLHKMEALGTLAGGIAHDFNNILNPILMSAGLVLQDAPRDSPARPHLQIILKSAERGRNLVRQIITFCRQKEAELRPIDIEPLVKETLKLIRSSTPRTIEIRGSIDKTRPVLTDPTQVHQLVMNLCSNAAYAMRGGAGVLEVELGEVEVGETAEAGRPELPPGTYVRLKIADTGTGMSKEVMERAFDPFFTTKKAGEGTGMGLAVVHGIVKASGGAVTVRSKPGKGSTFEVLLPVAVGASPDAQAVRPEPVAGRDRILLVDDEDVQVESIANALTRLGYSVLSTTSSPQALALFTDDPASFDLVLTDLTMPGLSGIELAAKVREIRADVPIVLCTGYSETVDAETALAMGIRTFLMKPFSIGEISQAIRRALAKG